MGRHMNEAGAALNAVATDINGTEVNVHVGKLMDVRDGVDSQGICKAGNRLARVAMVEAAWLWVRHQPDSALTQWFHHRTQGQKGRIRRVMIVALARKLAIALWRYVELGLIPEGAVVK